MDLSQKRPIRITCTRGLGEHLRREVEALGLVVRHEQSTTVELDGTMTDAMRLNLYLRTAFHVQLEIASFACRDGDQLYAEVVKLPWESLIPVDGYVSVVSRVDTPSVDNSMYPSLKVKDAIVDRISEALGARPDSGPRRDRAVVTLLWQGQSARLYLDTSGEKLSDRGYRRVMVAAPMRETLAAALLQTAGYTGQGPLINPMCGAGTLAIEAALIASGRAPGLLRNNFGFKHLAGFDEVNWQELRSEAHRAKQGQIPALIVASDSDPAAVNAAKKNAKTAGVDGLIRFEECDFADTTIPEGEGIVILNPPYGKRLGENEGLARLYAQIGDFFKQRCKGHTGWLFTGNTDLAKGVGLRTKRRFTFFNGEIECRLLKYELYGGSRKAKHQPGG